MDFLSLERYRLVFNRPDSPRTPVELAAQRAARAVSEGGGIVFCDNGGSAADAQHLAAEMLGHPVRAAARCRGRR